MSDIVERARLYIKEPWAHQDNWHDLMNVLAAEIERLGHHHAEFVVAATVRMTDQNTEIERLRETLRWIVEHSNDPGIVGRAKQELLR